LERQELYRRWPPRSAQRSLPFGIGGGAAQPTDEECENTSNHNPAAKVTQSIDSVKKDEISVGSFFARNVTPFG
jgi:hypothetical protein